MYHFFLCQKIIAVLYQLPVSVVLIDAHGNSDNIMHGGYGNHCIIITGTQLFSTDDIRYLTGISIKINGNT